MSGGEKGTFEISVDELRKFEAFEPELKKFKGITVEEREKMIRDIVETELIPLVRGKGHDYAGQGDSLSNLRDFGWRGVAVRIGDKYHRLKNFASVGELKVKDENIEDTLIDMIAYSFFCLIMKRIGQ
jgi:hypothetical protein